MRIMNPLCGGLRSVVGGQGASSPPILLFLFLYCFHPSLPLNNSPFTVSLGLLTRSPPSPPFPSLSRSVSLLLTAISGPHAGQVVPHPERLITFPPPAVDTSALAATAIHYLPWSRAARSSPLSV